MPSRVTLLWVLLAACGVTYTEPEELYLHSADYRWDQLADSLVQHDNGYSALRLRRYPEWSRLPEWNPPVRPLTRDDIGAFRGDARRISEGLSPVFDRDAFELTHEGLMELGERAFRSFPMGSDDALGEMTDDEERARAIGLWRHSDGTDERVGGLLRVRVGDAEGFAPTCSTCHARTEGAALVLGAANVDYDYGAIHEGRVVPSRWGAGRLDVTTDGQDNPVTIGDLRGIRFQRRLHRAATVRNGLVPLALRIETLMITSYDQRLRPPREVALAIAYYLWQLGDEPNPDETHPGAPLYTAQCARCHGRGRPSREAVDLDQVGTDPRVGESTNRGTGQYRVPTLVGVMERAALLNRGERITVRELLDDSTLGHDYGRSLADDEKDQLVDYLRTW